MAAAHALLLYFLHLISFYLVIINYLDSKMRMIVGLFKGNIEWMYLSMRGGKSVVLVENGCVLKRPKP